MYNRLTTALARQPARVVDDVMRAILDEHERAIAKFPTWPTDPLHALAVLGEEYGELNKAMLQLTYEPGKATTADVREEAIQTAAMALRLAMSLDRYEYKRGPQHSQERTGSEGDAFIGTRVTDNGFETLPDDYETGDY